MTPAIDEMRNIKRPEEIEVLRRIGKISAEGNRDAIAHAHPGKYQYQIEARAYFYDFDHGAQGASYLAIVGSGNDINTWHYFSNRHKIEAEPTGRVRFRRVRSITKRWISRAHSISAGNSLPNKPSGTRWISNARKRSSRCSRPATRTKKPTRRAKQCSIKPASAINGTDIPGHFVGLATHDVMRVTGPIKAGQVVTVEPIVEFLIRQMHFRVEDTILITNGAPENLSGRDSEGSWMK